MIFVLGCRPNDGTEIREISSSDSNHNIIDPPLDRGQLDCDTSDISYATDVYSKLERSCLDCHSSALGTTSGNLSLSELSNESFAKSQGEIWGGIITRVVSEDSMPPRSARGSYVGFTVCEKARLSKWIENEVTVESPTAECEDAVDPMANVLHRLSHYQYTNSLKEIVGGNLVPASDFPPDAKDHGYSNISTILSMSPNLLEKYMETAETLIEAAISSTAAVNTTHQAEVMSANTGAVSGAFYNIYGNGEIYKEIPFPRAGNYRFRIRAYENYYGPDHASMSLKLDNVVKKTWNVEALAAAPGVYEFNLIVTKGLHRVAVSFNNDAYGGTPATDRNLYVDYVNVYSASPSGSTYKNLITCTPDAANPNVCIDSIIRQFGKRAFRRPLTDAEVIKLRNLAITSQADASGDFYARISVALQAILSSPNFLYRVELDTQPNNLSLVHDLSAHELASRLSYFIWSSTPDDELLALADSGELLKNAVLDSQISRMLGDSRADALIDRFATEWIGLDKFIASTPNATLFPDFNNRIKFLMAAETREFIRDVLKNNLPTKTLLNADFTYLNNELAGYYGISGSFDGTIKKSVLNSTSHRKGILSHGSVLTHTSYDDRTSIVKRGAWILERMLCDAPPPPPPDVGDFPDEIPPGLSQREILEIHRQNPVCASCHTAMDPIGFGLENFDAAGKYRTQDNGAPIDSSGELPGGRAFADFDSLLDHLQAGPAFEECFSENMTTFALGRILRESDKCEAKRISTRARANGDSITAIIRETIRSPLFRKRRPVDGSN